VDGKEVWKTDLQKRYGRFNIAFGMTSTPVLHGDRLYLQLIHGEGNAATREAIVICLAKATGEEIWKQDRSSDAIQENEHSYASPVMYDDGKQAIFVTHGADYTIGHDPSTGAELFRVTGLNPRNHATRKYDPTLRFVASPSFAPGILVIPTAKGGPVVAVRPDIKGTIALESPGVLWTRPKTPDVPSPVVAGDQVYLCMADGTLHAVDRTTGQELYAKRTNPIRHRSSPVYADGHIYTTGRDGKVTVVKAGPEFEIVAQNEIGEDVSSSLAISNGTLYLRSFEALWAIRQK
jgi:outer membrane protein assembly factor BamB